MQAYTDYCTDCTEQNACTNERHTCQLPRLHGPSATFRHVFTVVDTYVPRNTSIGQPTAPSASSHDQQPYTTTPTTAPTFQHYGRTLPSQASTTDLPVNPRRHCSSTTALITSTATCLVKRTASPVGLRLARCPVYLPLAQLLPQLLVHLHERRVAVHLLVQPLARPQPHARKLSVRPGLQPLPLW